MSHRVEPSTSVAKTKGKWKNWPSHLGKHFVEIFDSLHKGSWIQNAVITTVAMLMAPYVATYLIIGKAAAWNAFCGGGVILILVVGIASARIILKNLLSIKEPPPVEPNLIEVPIPVLPAQPSAPPLQSPSPSEIMNSVVFDPYSLCDSGTGGIRESYEISYEGTFVEWKLYLLESVNQWNGNLKIRCTEQPNDTTYVVVFYVSEWGHEFLRASYDKNQLFVVMGTIGHVTTTEILLQDASIRLITDGFSF